MPTTGTQAIDRAAELLSRVVLADEPPAFAELVRKPGWRSRRRRDCCQALERHRLVHRDDAGGYEAGPLFALYASRHESADELIRLARPTLGAIGLGTGETVNLAVARGNTVVQIAQVDSRYLLGATNWVDVDVPPHCSALGKVFFAAGVLAPADRAVRAAHPAHHARAESCSRRQLGGFRRRATPGIR